MKQFLLLCLTCLLFALSFTQSAEAQSSALQFPKETLVARLEKISVQKKQNIVFDPVALKGIVVPILKLTQQVTAEQLVRKSLETTSLTCHVTQEHSIVVSAVDKTKKKTGTGKISGHISDRKGEPIPGATIKISGTNKVTISDIDGNYSLQAPAGSTTIEVSFLSFKKQTITEVQVEADKTTKLNITLKENEKELSEVTVTGQVLRSSVAGLILQQKEAISMTDGISSDQIKKTSDNNVAQVLKRVAGVTVNEGKFVTVRGMSERYNNVQLNGSSLPSTEPNRRNFSFDIIPSTLIDNITVSKTFTPDLPGEFTGGLVQVKTLSVPETKFLSISLGTGGNSISTGKEFQTNKRYAADYLLGEIDQRTWYTGRKEENYAQTVTNAGQMNHFGYDIYRAIPMQNYALSFGLPIKINDNHSLGVVAALTYRHEENTETIKEVHLRARDSLMSNVAAGKSYKFVTAVGAVANVGWKTANHLVTWRNLYNNRFTHTNLKRFMRESYGGDAQVEVYSTPLITNLKQTQIDGEHAFFGQKLKVTWNADYNTTTRTNPDDRYASGIFTDVPQGSSEITPSLYDGKYMIYWALISPTYAYVGDQHLMYSNLEEMKKNGGINAEYHFNVFGLPQKLKAGYLRSFRKADFQQQYLHAGLVGIHNELDGMPLQELYNPDNFASGKLEYGWGGYDNRVVDYYEGRQTLEAMYLLVDFSPVRQLRIIGGLREENTNVEVLTTISGYNGLKNVFYTTDSLFHRTSKDLLPSLTAIYSITDKLNFRAAYSKTLARPDFRELSRTTYYNVSDRIDVKIKNPIEQSYTKNYDLRLEWYPQAGELISLSAFYKNFTKPVEKIAKLQADMQNYVLYTVNLDAAVVKGVELNFRKSFDFISSLLKNVWLDGNASFIEGNIEYNQFGDKSRKRPLQGLSPYMINGSLNYEGKQLGAAVNYTRVGRTLVMGGEYAKHDEYENPRNVLDLQISARFLKQRLELKLNASDILNEDIIVYRNCDYDSSNDQTVDPGQYNNRTALGLDYNYGDWVLSRSSKGVNYSFSVSYKF